MDGDVFLIFQYVGTDGAWHGVDDVIITDSLSTTIVAEGFEGGAIPAGWSRLITNADYTGEVMLSSEGSATLGVHSGSYAAKISWDKDYAGQDEWLITPDLAPLGEGPYSATFWNAGSMEFVEAGVFNALYSCDGGATTSLLYTFPGTGEDTSWCWYENTFVFSCN